MLRVTRNYDFYTYSKLLKLVTDHESERVVDHLPLIA